MSMADEATDKRMNENDAILIYTVFRIGPFSSYSS